MATVYASTATLRGKQPLEERLKLFREHGMSDIELGDGVILGGPFDPAALPTGGKYMIHNYFPHPAEPFILNLASADSTIRKKSMDLVRNALTITKKLSAPAYTVHAGFVTDPDMQFVFPKVTESDATAKSLERFIASIEELLPLVEKAGVKLLIETNVCEQKNTGLLLLQTPDEFSEFFARVSHPQLGILVDTGHLNVSAHTFGFDRMEFIERHAKRIGAFHLHENDGTADQHLPVTEGSWVTDVLRRPEFRDTPRIAEAKFTDVEAIARQIALLKSI